MPFETLEVNGVKILFDKDKTQNFRTDFVKPCDCQYCRNFYKHIGMNTELIEFLSNFGVHYNYPEEVFSWDLEDNKESFICYEGYYGVFGKIDGDEFDFEKFGVKLSFAKARSIPNDREGEFFWLGVEGIFSYILDEERELPVVISQGNGKLKIMDKIKAIFNKNFMD